jgi:hypothetical protein
MSGFACSVIAEEGRGCILLKMSLRLSQVAALVASWREAQSDRLSLLYLRMSRIFLTLASVSLCLLIGALVLGLSMGDLYARPEPSMDTLHWATIHRLLGLGAALAVVFVECVVVTYFIGTSRWCREVVETYRLDRALVVASNRLKRQTFPWVLAGMLVVIGVVALGGAADIGATLQRHSQNWAFWHLLSALLGVAFVFWTYLVSWNNITANHDLIQKIAADVARIRNERGLDKDFHEGPSQPPTI